MSQKFKTELSELLRQSYQQLQAETPSYAVSLILSEDHEILLIERAKREGDNWSGQMAFPGGKFELSDSDLLSTAIRETKEEVNLHLEKADHVGPLLDMSLRRRGLIIPGTLHSHVFMTKKQDLHLDTNEVENAFWLPLDFFKDVSNVSTYTFHRDNVQIELPCLVYQERNIWGLTYHILAHFFHMYGKLDGSSYRHLVPLYSNR